MERKKLISKKVSSSDRRSYNIVITTKGESLAERALNWHNGILNEFGKFSHQEKKQTMILLMKMIACLHDAKIIPLGRVCLTCENFFQDTYLKIKDMYECRFLETIRATWELSINCKEYVPRVSSRKPLSGTLS